MKKEIKLIRDVLDNQLVDREGQPLGKVDGITAELREGEPPRLLYVETGLTTAARRLHPRLGRLAQRLGRRWGVRRGRPFRVEWSKVKSVGIDVEVDLRAEETEALAWEEWLRKNVVGRIPF
jgi:sporulation protein YlmC with PRC-barrel domain